MNYNKAIDKVYVFRPLPDKSAFSNNWRRYADGKWIEDDGEPDLAFSQGCDVLYVKLPYYRGILWHWMDADTAFGANPWHYFVVNPKDGWGESWAERSKHPNELAGRSAMSTCASLSGCANGSGPGIYEDNEWIRRGLLWEKDTMKLVKHPKNPVCFLCENGGYGHKLKKLQEKLSDAQRHVEYAKEEIDKADKLRLDMIDEIKYYEEKISQLT